MKKKPIPNLWSARLPVSLRDQITVGSVFFPYIYLMDTNTAIYIAIGILAAFVAIQKIRNRKASTMTVKEKINEGALIIDVRTHEEFAGGGYPKAKNIPLDELGAGMDKLPKDKPIVLYCASGMRSGQAARMLQAAGFSDVTSAGGLSDMPR